MLVRGVRQRAGKILKLLQVLDGSLRRTYLVYITMYILN